MDTRPPWRDVSRPRLLFVSHDASRTGAPLALLTILQWLRAKTDWTLNVLCARGGELVNEFEKIGPTTLYGAWSWGVPRTLPQRLLRKSGLAYRQDYHTHPLERIYPRGSVDLIYGNTVAVGSILSELQHLQVPVIAHIHELAHSIRYYAAGNWPPIRALASRYIAVSQAVAHDLEGEGIPPGKIHVVYEPLPAQAVTSTGRGEHELRSSLNIPDGAAVIMGCGLGRWRKGVDLFVQMLVQLVSRVNGQPFVGLWVGGGDSGREYEELLYDVRKAGLRDLFRHVPHVASATPYFEMCDIFCMTSREDPFPLVNLEAAAMGKPIVCFGGSGGSAELVGEDAGYSVPYLDVSGMAQRVAQLMASPEERKKRGAVARERVQQRFVPDVIVPQIQAVVEDALAHSSSLQS